MRITFFCETCNVESEPSSIKVSNRLEMVMIFTCKQCGKDTEAKLARERDIEDLRSELALD